MESSRHKKRFCTSAVAEPMSSLPAKEIKQEVGGIIDEDGVAAGPDNEDASPGVPESDAP